MSDDSFANLGSASGFDWDSGNAPKVRARHDVGPGECEQAFFSEPFIVAADVKHSTDERRWRALGRTVAGRHVFIIFTKRGTLIRVTSARNMNRKEKHEYAQAQKRIETDTDIQD